MAVCEICGAKISMNNQARFGVPGIDAFLPICKTCDEQIAKLLRPNVTQEDLQEAQEYMAPFAQNPQMKKEVSEYLFSLISEADDKKIELDNKAAELEQQKIEHEKQTEAQTEAWEAVRAEEQKRRQEAAPHRATNIKDFKTTTGQWFDGYKITEYIGIVSGEAVLGTGFLIEFSARLSDVMGISSDAYEGKFSEAKKVALDKAIEKALDIGANALVAVDFDILTIANNMIVTCANGTAVRIEKD